jgi:hypothetical protein
MALHNATIRLASPEPEIRHTHDPMPIGLRTRSSTLERIPDVSTPEEHAMC